MASPMKVMLGQWVDGHVCWGTETYAFTEKRLGREVVKLEKANGYPVVVGRLA